MTARPTLQSVAQRTTAIAVGVLIVDATSKATALFLAARNYGHEIILPAENPDFSLGVASAALPIMVILSSLGILVFGGYTTWAATGGVVPVWVPGLLIGGAVGNLADRLFFGAVHDWLELGKVVVNLGDLAVVAGLLGYFASLAFAHRER